MSPQPGGDSVVEIPMNLTITGEKVETKDNEEAAPKEEAPKTTDEPKDSDPKEGQKPKTEEEKPSASEHEKQVERAREEVRLERLDRVAEKFASLDAGEMTKEELREFFQKYPLIAEVANRSKRFKDRFRELTEKTERKGPEQKEEDDDEEEERPITLKDLKRVQDEADSRALERSLRVERVQQAEAFATKNGIKDEAFDKLVRTADAIFKANEELGYDKALQAAYNAFNPSKPDPAPSLNGGMNPDPLTKKAKSESALDGIELITLEDLGVQKRLY